MTARRAFHVEGPALWTLRFLPVGAGVGGGERQLVGIVRYPTVAAAHVERSPVPVSQFIERGGWDGDIEGLPVVVLPPGSGTPFELQRQVDEWMSVASADGDVAPIAEIPLRAGRLRWRPDRAALTAGDDQVADAITGLAHFAWYFRQVASMEATMDGEWPILHDDAQQIASRRIGGKDRRRLTAQGVEMFRRRQWFIRLTIGLERPDAVQPAQARRVFLELANQADMVTRLQLIDDAIEGAEDLYERIGEQMTERSMFLQGLAVEVAILLAILLETALFVCDAF